MLSKERLEQYRKMTPGERLTLTLDAMRSNFPYLYYGPDEVVSRRFKLIQRDNDARNRALLERLAAAGDSHGES